MRSLITTIVCSMLLTFTISCKDTKQQTDAADKPQTEKDKISYAIGVNLAGRISMVKDEIDIAMVKKGLTDSLQGNELLVTNEEAGILLQSFSEKIRAKQQEEMTMAAQKNLEEGQAFLEANKSKEGIVTTDSGLQYMVIKEGSGRTPGSTDRIKVNYKGTLLDGTEFDSSDRHGGPAEFQADQVIKGWTEGVQLMKEGGKYRLFIPSDLAYGPRSVSQEIGPNSTLIFEIELLEILDNTPQENTAE